MGQRLVTGSIVVAMLATVGAARAADPQLPAPPGVRAAFDAHMATCAARGDAACAAAGLRAATDELAARVDAATDVSGWVRLATELHGPVQAVPPRVRPLDEAILALYRATDLVLTDELTARVRSAAGALSPAAAREAAALVSAVVAANELVERATAGTQIRALDPARAAMLATFVGSAPPGSVDPRLAAEWEHALGALAAIDMALIKQAAVITADAIAAFDWQKGGGELDLPMIFIGGPGDTVHSEGRIILIDESGNDTYTSAVGASPLAGAGVGVGIDQGDGDDVYVTEGNSQGFALGGVGMLMDEGGTDLYDLLVFGHGGAVGGVGVLYDAGSENDRYLSSHAEEEEPIGTKAAVLGGVGLLVDEGGSNVYHQDSLDGLIWGAAGGLALLASLGEGDDLYRADAIDHGPLLPGDPPLGFFAGPIQVSAEVNGVAILYEEGGNDTYRCGEFVRQGCQGAAGLGSLGLSWDLAGDDVYAMGQTFSVDLVDELCGCSDLTPVEHPIFPMGQGAGYGFGAPPTVPFPLGILYDEAGSDGYTANEWAQGYGTFHGYGVLYDTGGAPDTYEMETPLVGARADGSNWVDGLIGLGLDE